MEGLGERHSIARETGKEGTRGIGEGRKGDREGRNQAWGGDENLSIEGTLLMATLFIEDTLLMATLTVQYCGQ